MSDKSARSVFVGNIPYDTSEDKLKDIFSEVGPVLSFRLVYDRDSGKPKGYGFCEYQDEETALSAMRNLNQYDINGRTLRVDYATTEKNKEEMKALALAQAPLESPYGDSVDPQEAPEAISKAVASLPPEQMFELMKQMKIVIQNNPVEARNMLLQNPQLAYALLQAQVVMRIVSPEVAMTLLHKQNEPPQPLMPSDQPGPSQPQPVGPPMAQGPQPVPPPSQQMQPMGAAQPNHGARGPPGGMPGPEPAMAQQRPGPGPGMPGGGMPPGRQQGPMPVMMQQQGGMNEPRFQDGRGPPVGMMNQPGPRPGMMHPGDQGRGPGFPVDQGGPMEQDPYMKDQRRSGPNPMDIPPRQQGNMELRGPMEPRGGPMDQRGPMEPRGGPVDQRGPPMDQRGMPVDQRGGPPMDQHGGPPMDQRGGPPMDQRGGPSMDQRGGPPMDHRGGPPMDQRGGPMSRGMPMDQRGGPMDQRGMPMDQRGGPPMEQRGSPMTRGGPPMDQRGVPMDQRGGPPMDQRGGPMDPPDMRRQGYEGHGMPPRMPGPDGRAMPRGLPPGMTAGGIANLSAPSSGQAQPTAQDQEKAALIMQVLGLSNEQINSLPQDQRQSILLLKEQLARSQGQMP